MKLHLITNLFAPDELAGASLFSDLAFYLREQGHDVRVTCTFSYYPAWRLRPEDVGVNLREESFHGIPVRRVRMHVPERPTGKARMMSDLSFLLSLLRRARFPGWLPDVVITASPMFSQCLAQRFLYPGRRIPRLIVVQDFVVDAALELGLLRLPGLPPILKALERWAFRSAQTLTTISPGMLEKLRGIVGADRRTVFIPNWIHGSLAAEIQRQQSTAGEREKGVLFYSGNLGVKQGLPDFLEMYRQTAWGWTLRIHGGGAEAERLKSGLQPGDGVSMGGVLEEREYIRTLLSVSACLVTQKPGVGANFLPSKLLPALATGTPVMAVCDPGSPLGMEVREGGFGAVVSPGDAAGLRTVLERWRSDAGELRACAERARERAVLYARKTVLPRYEEELGRFNHREHREHRGIERGY